MLSFNFRFIFSFALVLFFTQSAFARQNPNFDCKGLANPSEPKQQKLIKKCIESDNQTVYLNRQYLQKFSKISHFWSPKQKEIAKRKTFMKLNNNFNHCLKTARNSQKNNLVSVPEVCICWQDLYKKHINFMENDFSVKNLKN